MCVRLYFERGFASIEAINTFVLFCGTARVRGKGRRGRVSKGGCMEGAHLALRIAGGQKRGKTFNYTDCG